MSVPSFNLKSNACLHGANCRKMFIRNPESFFEKQAKYALHYTHFKR